MATRWRPAPFGRRLEIFQPKLTRLFPVFVFSHDKQETEEVVQLQEGGGKYSAFLEITSMLLPHCQLLKPRLETCGITGVCVAGEAVGTEEQTAVTITGVPQAAFADHNVQYQFRTENSGGQVSAIHWELA